MAGISTGVRGEFVRGRHIQVAPGVHHRQRPHLGRCQRPDGHDHAVPHRGGQLARDQDDQDLLRREPAEDRQQRAQRLDVRPLGVVDDHDAGPGIAPGEQSGGVPRRLESAQQLVNHAEGGRLLPRQADRPRHAGPALQGQEVLDHGGLADPGRAFQHRETGRPREQPVQVGQLALPADQLGVPGHLSNLVRRSALIRGRRRRPGARSR